MRKLLLLWVLASMSCSTKAPAPNKFSDPILAKIYDQKDKRLTDSLLLFLRSPDPVYRREAALAFASVQDSAASLALGASLLEDSDTVVRRNIAFSLGQTGGTQAVNALIPALENKDRIMLREVLEALGKTIDKTDITILSKLESNDSLLQEGLAAAFYHLGVRKIADSIITRKASEFLTNRHSYKTRLAAAGYFARSQKIEGKGFEEKLIVAAQQDKSSYVRMTAVLGFRHLESSEAIYILKEIITTDSDYRVRVNAVRASQTFALPEIEEITFNGLRDSVEMVRVAASEVIRNKAEGYKGKSLPAAIEAASGRVKANLFAAFFKANPTEGIVKDIIKLYPSASNYYKSDLLSALGEAKPPYEEKAFDFISGELLNDKNEKVVRTSAAEALVSINKNPGTKITLSRFLKVYEEAISQKSDVAVTGLFSSALMDTSLKYKEEIKNLGFLYAAKAKLSLPKDIESLQPLTNAIAYLEGKEKPAQLKNEFNHPMDWEFIKTIPVGQRIEIRTTKGMIVLRMLINEAPGSVANFVTLVKQKYFDGKYIHRVVPNFVIQTGCNRGDGYGSEDYSIRSEFSLRRYKTGSVGMASAGKDTEGTQWFITHSPTPHLDGRYTIFAETISGMEVVHQIEVGDKILEATLVNMEKTKK